MTSYSSPKSVWWYERSNLICLQWLPMNSWTTFRSRLPLKWTFLKTPSLRARSGPIAGTLKTPELEQALSLSALKVRKWFNPHKSNFKSTEFHILCKKSVFTDIFFKKSVFEAFSQKLYYGWLFSAFCKCRKYFYNFLVNEFLRKCNCKCLCKNVLENISAFVYANQLINHD